MPTDPRVRQAMVDIAESMSRPQELGETLDRLTRSACDTIPGIDFASINILRPNGTLETIAPTSPVAVQLDKLQSELEEGPCYNAAEDNGQYVSENLADDPRWPQYGPKAAVMGAKAQMGLDLPTGGKGRASLNLYSITPASFGEAVEMAEMFASSAALAMGFARSLDTLSAALKTRTEIGQALGILMERYQIDSDRAFQFLVRVSQDTNTRLRDVAADLVRSLEKQSQKQPD
jgi:hypothetical protein